MVVKTDDSRERVCKDWREENEKEEIAASVAQKLLWRLQAEEIYLLIVVKYWLICIYGSIS